MRLRADTKAVPPLKPRWRRRKLWKRQFRAKLQKIVTMDWVASCFACASYLHADVSWHPVQNSMWCFESIEWVPNFSASLGSRRDRSLTRLILNFIVSSDCLHLCFSVVLQTSSVQRHYSILQIRAWHIGFYFRWDLTLEYCWIFPASPPSWSQRIDACIKKEKDNSVLVREAAIDSERLRKMCKSFTSPKLLQRKRGLNLS